MVDTFATTPSMGLSCASTDCHLGGNRTRWTVSDHHAFPDIRKQYDLDYMAYLVRILRRCKEYGFRVCKLAHDTELIWSSPHTKMSFPVS